MHKRASAHSALSQSSTQLQTSESFNPKATSSHPHSPPFRPSTTIHSSLNCFRHSLRRETILAPGPPTDHIVSLGERKRGITKAALLALAREKNVRNGREADEGLQEFLPSGAIQRSFSVSQDAKKLGFRQVLCSASQTQVKKPATSLSTSTLHPYPAPAPRDFSHTLAALQDYKRVATACIPATAARLNRRLILTKAANQVRAETMATVKINIKERELNKPVIQCSVYSIDSRLTPAEQIQYRRTAFLQLYSSLETELVDRLAATEIETIKKVGRDALYPRLNCEQLEEKLGRLKEKTEAKLRPLEEVRRMEMIVPRNKRLKR